ncbi:MAG: MIP/aquaporin family protein [Sphingomicrobium sp.]|nr:aquaporin [Sphingomonadales bacterium]
MLLTLKGNWRHYLTEALGLFTFMVCAGALMTLFQHPAFPAYRAMGSDLARRTMVGAGLGCATVAIIYAPWSQRSGAHINPAVTWSFFRLGKIGGLDAVLYTVAQFIGAALAPVALSFVIGRAFAHPAVMYGATLPKAGGPVAAFAAEFAISFGLMLAVLLCLNSVRGKSWAGLVVAVLIAVYVALESPISGMSLNPARSFGAALSSGEWKGLWIYFTAPPLAMLLATEAFLLLKRRGLVAQTRGSTRRFVIIRDFEDGPHYPVAPTVS